MLRQLTSDLENFKTATFQAGLNIALAERTKQASSKDSRNAVGKTSLIKVIDFILGAEARPAHILRRPELRNSTFSLEFDADGITETASRSIATVNSIFVEGQGCTRVQDWRSSLGKVLYSLTGAPDEPRYRSLAAFYLRDVAAGAFASATETHRKQAAIDTQPALAWLFGLDLGLVAKVRDVLETTRGLSDLRRVARDPVVGMTMGRAQDLEASIRTLTIERDRLATQLRNFTVVERYTENREQADALSRQIRSLNDSLVMKERRQRDIAKAIEQEDSEQPDAEYLEDMYRQVGIVLPRSVRRRFEEVADFHSSVVSNRRRYLESEFSSLSDEIDTCKTRLAELDGRRAALMRLLREGGALETYNELQAEVGDLTGRLAELAERKETIDRWENANRHLQLKAAELEILISSDLTERTDQIKAIAQIFSGYAYQIYGSKRPASLAIEPSRSGYRFVPTIGGDRSEGVRSIAIFCFDLAMAVTARRIGHGPDFLIHDSHLYDNVEARQIASALNLAAEVAAAEGMQYVVTINSDVLERAEKEGFNAEYHECARMTDAYESGGLFGIRFN